MNIMDKIKLCDFCKKLKKNNYNVYQVGFQTDNGHTYYIGVVNLERKMSQYLFDRGCHLSATQIILLRPDLLHDYLSNNYNTNNETIEKTFLQEVVICEDCYKRYIEQVPEK